MSEKLERVRDDEFSTASGVNPFQMERIINRLIDTVNDLKDEVDTLKRAEADRCRMEGNEI
jgi:hypothetical protein